MKGQFKKWTESEIDKIKELYPKYGSEYCKTFISRTTEAIQRRAKILGLRFNGTKFKYSKEYLIPIILNSKSIKDVLDKIGLRAAGGNYGVINKYIEKYEINVDHFKEFENERIKKFIIKSKESVKPLIEVLVENSDYNRVKLKERLYKEGLKKRECELCGQGEEWKGKKMSLILDHKNGVHNDNRIDNLRIVCPNCNATLDTHAGKNIKKK